MQELIKIKNKVIGIQETNAVSAREIHEYLGVKTRFDMWISRAIEKYDFLENIDFCTKLGESQNGRPATEYIVTLDMAKELAMLENNAKGKETRKYFLAVEKEYQKGMVTTSIDYAPVLAEVKNFLVNLEETLNTRLDVITTEIEEYKYFAMNMKEAVQGSVLKVEKYQEDVKKTISDTYNYLKFQPMSREERQRIAMRVTTRAKAIALESGINEPEATKRVYQEVCRAFKVKTYHDLERSKFAMAYEFIPEITINGSCLPPLEVKDDFEQRWGIDKTEGSRGKTVWGDTPEYEII